MTGTEIARRESDSWVDVLPQVGDLAGKIAQTPFVPKDMQGKPASVAACILTGRALGLDPMVALAHISVVQGRPVLSAELMRSLILSNGHSLRFPEMTATRVVAEGRRRGDEDWTRVQFTLDEAKAAGLAGKDNWRKHPVEMLTARATSRLARLIFADCLGGLSYTADEMDDVEVTAETGAARRPTGRTAKRAGTTTPVARRSAPSAAPAATPAPLDEPPLDDEPQADAETGEIVDAEVVDETEPSATAKQLQAIAAGMAACGWDDRDDRLRLASAVAGRALTTSKELTKAEAGELLDALTFAQNTDDPQVALAGLIEATRGEK